MGEAEFRALVQQPFDAVELMNHWSLSVSDFIERLISIDVFLTVILTILATGC